MATEKPSAKTSTKKPPAAARAQAGTLPVEMSITDDSPAAGQMIQCANLMLGLEETAGLTTIGVYP